MSSSLSTDSPPFNPRGGGNGVGVGSMSIALGGGASTSSATGASATTAPHSNSLMYNSGAGMMMGSSSGHHSPTPPQTVMANLMSGASGGVVNHNVMSRSHTSSPLSHASSSNSVGASMMYGGTNIGANSAGSGGGNGGPHGAEVAHSNAISRHTFQYGGETLEIRNVWAENVEEEMAVIRELIETHPYVAMDTEFPGVVARPVSETYSPDYHYKSLKVNVDLLRIIQLGLSFADSEGNFAKGCPCWQFNFQFDLHDDMFAQDSIDLLVNSGISFEDHARRGIDPHLFGELLMVSGLVLDDRVKWVSFHSGYDYGYLLKLLTTVELPHDEKGFFEALRMYFPTIYDIKYMTSLCDGHFGGLQKLADALGCPRIGPEHQAGSDSLLTMATYFALVKTKFNGGLDDSKYRNELYGYGNNHTVRKGAAHAMSHQNSNNGGSTSGSNGNNNSLSNSSTGNSNSNSSTQLSSLSAAANGLE